MSKLAINTGATINDGTGDPLRDGAIKINSNFDEIYTNLGNNSSLLFSVDFTTPPQDMQVLQYSSATGKFEFNFSGGQGNTGVGISTANITSGNLIITLSNTTTIDVGTVVGTTGNTGPQGPIGNTGVGISVANITSGNLIITLSDASTIDAGTVVGPIGNTGPQGPVGNTGPAGAGSGNVNSVNGGYANNRIVRYDGTSGNNIQNSLVTIADDGAITAPSNTSSMIPFYYATLASFPSAVDSHGAVAHAHDTGKMYYAHAGQWFELANVSDITANGTVTSVAGTGTVNGLTLTGTVTTTGNLTLGGTLSNVDLTSQVTGILPLANGGTNTATPGLIQGTNVTISGTWPNQTINSTLTTFTGLTDVSNASLTVDKIYLPAITMLNVTNNVASAYRFDQYGVADNPTIYALNGTTIAFNLNVAGHPFLIQTSANTNYNDGLTHVTTTGTVTTGASAQGKTSGTLYWKIPNSISGNYQYICSIHGVMVGVINIKDFSTI